MLVHKLTTDPRLAEEIREEYAYIAGALCEINGCVSEAECLYGSSETRAILSEGAGAFFNRHGELLVDFIMLALARLTGPSMTGRGNRAQKNLALARLWEQLPETKYSQLRNDLREECCKIEVYAKPFQIYRHKFLGHSSLEHHISHSVYSVPEVSMTAIRELIAKIEAYLFHLDSFFTGIGSLSYSVSEGRGSAEDLLRHLSSMLVFERKRFGWTASSGDMS